MEEETGALGDLVAAHNKTQSQHAAQRKEQQDKAVSTDTSKESDIEAIDTLIAQLESKGKVEAKSANTNNPHGTNLPRPKTRRASAQLMNGGLESINSRRSQ
jgi:hypothetical protein